MVTFEDESCLGRRLGLSVTCRHVLFSDELLLPHMKRVDGLITDNRKRLLHKLHIGQVLKVGVSPFSNPNSVPGNVVKSKSRIHNTNSVFSVKDKTRNPNICFCMWIKGQRGHGLIVFCC